MYKFTDRHRHVHIITNRNFKRIIELTRLYNSADVRDNGELNIPEY